jgi:hypothetical protein
LKGLGNVPLDYMSRFELAVPVPSGDSNWSKESNPKREGLLKRRQLTSTRSWRIQTSLSLLLPVKFNPRIHVWEVENCGVVGDPILCRAGPNVLQRPEMRP